MIYTTLRRHTVIITPNNGYDRVREPQHLTHFVTIIRIIMNIIIGNCLPHRLGQNCPV